MNCKFCNAQLEEGTTKCPACGAENPAGNGKLSAGKIALLAVLVVAAIAVVIALVLGGLNTAEVTETTAPTETSGTVISGSAEDVTYKSSYTLSDEEVLAGLDTVVATAGSREMTNADLQVYYWMQFYNFVDSYSSYVSMFGLDVYSPLDSQTSIDGSTTWQQYFLSNGVSTWHSYVALCQMAEDAGYELDAEYRDYLDSLPASLNESATSSGFADAQEMLKADMGAGATLESYLGFLEDYYLGYMYYSYVMENTEVTDEEVEAYFTEHEAEYAENGLDRETQFIDVRHILVCPEGGTTDESGNVTYSEEEWAACLAEAQALLDEYLAGEATEDSFAQMANDYSEDTGSNSNGGLYTDVYEGQMVEEFENWCFDPSRTYGETGLVKTTYGYHIMFFVESRDAWYETAWSDLVSELGEQVMTDAMAAYPLSVDYSAVALGNVSFDTAE